MSQSITWATAEGFIADYQSMPIAIKDSNGNIIKGFRVDANHIKTILGLTGTPQIPELFIIPAMKPGTGLLKDFTVVITGIDANNDITTGNVYDFCAPCPANCPNSF